MSIGVGIIKKIIGKGQVVDLATEEGKALAKAYLAGQMTGRIKSIAASMRKASLTPDKGQAFVHDALFRLWRSVMDFPGAGHLADIIRDSHEAKAPAIPPATTSQDALRIIATWTVEQLI